MNHKAILVAIAALALGGCGSASDSSAGGAQAELAELLIDDSMVGADATCMRGKTAELSADDARFLIDNIDATDTAGFSDELQAWAESLLECIDLDEQLAPDSGQADDPVTSESTDSGIDLASVSKSGFATWVTTTRRLERPRRQSLSTTATRSTFSEPKSPLTSSEQTEHPWRLNRHTWMYFPLAARSRPQSTSTPT
jgi:hypothetical protein